MSKYKAQTGKTPLSSSEGNTEEKGQLLSPSAKTDNTRIYMQNTRRPSLNTSKSGKNALTTPDNTPTTEKMYLHAKMAKTTLSILLSAGLIKRYEVQLTDSITGLTTVTKIRYEFDLSLWTEDLELK